MTTADRLFYGWLALAFGPLFILGGWLAAFTEVGFFLIMAGSLLLLAAPLLLRSLRALIVASALLALAWTWPYLLGKA